MQFLEPYSSHIKRGSLISSLLDIRALGGCLLAKEGSRRVLHSFWRQIRGEEAAGSWLAGKCVRAGSLHGNILRPRDRWPLRWLDSRRVTWKSPETRMEDHTVSNLFSFLQLPVCLLSATVRQGNGILRDFLLETSSWLAETEDKWLLSFKPWKLEVIHYTKEIKAILNASSIPQVSPKHI